MRSTGIALLAAASLAFAIGCGKQAPAPRVDAAKLRLFAPLPATVPIQAGQPVEKKIALGRMLYYEPRISRDQKISCNSCHELDHYGVDNEPTSDGIEGRQGDRNSPSVYNAAIHFVQFWDGRAPNVEEQAKGPVLNPVEMAMANEQQVVAVLNSMPEYVAAFRDAFPGESSPVSFNNMAIAIGAFERGLLTPSRWDKFLKGDSDALTGAEKAGFLAFSDAGCPACHAGALVGGNLYQKLGLVKPYPDESDPGRFKVTGDQRDRLLFKVPSLRNVAWTAPYFHNGKVASLNAAVAEMAEYQLGATLSRAEVASIVTWLHALTGEIPLDYIRKPELPKSTQRTPKPLLAAF